MKEAADLTTALDRCLERVSRGEALETILDDYPGYALELRRLLSAAVAFDEGALPPAEAWKARARRDLVLRLRAQPRVSRGRPPAVLRRLSFALAATALAFVSVGTAAAQTALPGQMLYPWKIVSEDAWRAVQTDPLELDLALLGRRTDEWVRVRGLGAEAIAQAEFQRLVTRLAAYPEAEDQAQIRAALHTAAVRLVEAGVEEDSILPSDLELPGILPSVEITPLPLLLELQLPVP